MKLPKSVNWETIAEEYFHLKLYPYQVNIINKAFTFGIKKITIRATTRAGKSYSMAQVAILKAVFCDKHRVGVVAPTNAKTRIIMNYIAELLAGDPKFDDMVMLNSEGLNKLDRLRNEVSKNRITFTNGSSIEAKSVDLDSRGFGAMGFAYDTTIVDETDEIDDESYSKIYRMLVEVPDSQLIEIGNPWRLGHFHQHHYDEGWERIHITWQDCVEAGRMTKEAVADQQKELTALEFGVLFDADFPEELEFAIFSQEALANCTRKLEYLQFDKIVMGVDVARGGRDRTVITIGGVYGEKIAYIEHIVMDTRDTMQIVGRVRELIDSKYVGKPMEIVVDSIGGGAGVNDRLAELNYNVREFVAGSNARNTERFTNLKTEVAFKVAELMKDGKITNVPPGGKFILHFRSWIYEVRSDKQVKLVDSKKSPDEGDSFLMMCSNSLYNEVVMAKGFEQGTVYPSKLRSCNPYRRNMSIGAVDP